MNPIFCKNKNPGNESGVFGYLQQQNYSLLKAFSCF